MNKGVKAEIGESLSSSSSSNLSSSLPGSMYSITKLDGSNWSSWFMRVMAIFVEKELDAVVDGSLVMTESKIRMFIFVRIIKLNPLSSLI